MTIEDWQRRSGSDAQLPPYRQVIVIRRSSSLPVMAQWREVVYLMDVGGPLVRGAGPVPELPMRQFAKENLVRSPRNAGARTIRGAGAAFLVLLASTIPGVVAGEPPLGDAANILAQADLDRLVGQRVDIAASAYQYRADRKREENAPESWLALMRYANLPLNKPLDVNTPALGRVLCGLLWEEIRPIERLELIWPAGAQRRPAPEDVEITTLDATSTASSWWNNLSAVRKTVNPAVATDGTSLAYELQASTCGIVISVGEGKQAVDFAVPEVRVLVADTWKKMDFEIEWGYDESTAGRDYSGHVELYDGRITGLSPLDGDTGTTTSDLQAWQSLGKSASRRGVKASLLYMGTSKWRRVQPFTTQQDDVARTLVTVWTAAGNFSFLAADLENGPILAPEYGFFVRRTSVPTAPQSAGEKPSALPAVAPAEPPIELASQAGSARAFMTELQARELTTIRQRIRLHDEQTWEGAVTAMRGGSLPPHPAPPQGSEPVMQVQVPCARLTAQWNLGAWHLVRHAEPHPQTGRLWFNDHPYGILGAETYMVLAALDLMGSHKAAGDGFDQWVSLPMDPDSTGHHEWALPDRPNGLFTEGHGCLTHAVGPPGVGGQMDGVHAFGPGSIGWALTQHYALTGDKQWLEAAAPRIVANAQWMLRQRQTVADMVPGGQRLWCKGLQPALQVTPDSGGLWMQFYECEAYYWISVMRLADTLMAIDPAEGNRLGAQAIAYREDLRAAVERSIALSPVVPVRDGTFHSVIPFACYVRGLATGAWGWQRDGSGAHVGPLYWETVQSAAALISPAELLSPNDVRVQGYLDVLEDRLLLENSNVGDRDWFLAGWQYQGGLERTANMHLAADDIPTFLRSFLNCYAVDILPESGYVFNEHAVHGPPDKIFEEAAFLERFRNLLVMEQGNVLWIARGTPRAWLNQGQTIRVKNAPTQFGTLTYAIASDADNGTIAATLELPLLYPSDIVRLRLRHPAAAPIKSVAVNGQAWSGFDADKETIDLRGLTGTVSVVVNYR